MEETVEAVKEEERLALVVGAAMVQETAVVVTVVEG